MHADHAIQAAEKAAAEPLASVSDETLAGEILRRYRSSAQAHSTEGISEAAVEEMANARGIFFNRPGASAPAVDPATGQPVPAAPRFPAIRNFLSGLLSTASPIIMEWIAGNLPLILAKLLAGLGTSGLGSAAESPKAEEKAHKGKGH